MDVTCDLHGHHLNKKLTVKSDGFLGGTVYQFLCSFHIASYCQYNYHLAFSNVLFNSFVTNIFVMHQGKDKHSVLVRSCTLAFFSGNVY